MLERKRGTEGAKKGWSIHVCALTLCVCVCVCVCVHTGHGQACSSHGAPYQQIEEREPATCYLVHPVKKGVTHTHIHIHTLRTREICAHGCSTHDSERLRKCMHTRASVGQNGVVQAGRGVQVHTRRRLAAYVDACHVCVCVCVCVITGL